jgi:tRNA(Ile)-lysidine synthase
MLREFESNIAKTGLFNKKHHLLLAISAGVDSVVLACLLKEGGFTFSLAHCNFRLRDKESDLDMKFCIQLAKKLNVKIYTSTFDTHAYCTEHKLNVQLAARKLRYEWFHKIIKEHHFDYLLTAHHANDVIETIFINLLRGTGINGLKGIPEKKGKVVRPLLKFKKEDIIAYSKSKKISFRLDKSNLEDKYERNFLRLHVIPLLKKLNPKIEETFIKNTIHLSEEAGIVRDFLEQKSVDLVTQTPGFLFINIKKLKKEIYISSVLNSLINGYGFNETQQKNILKNILDNGVSGKIFNSSTHSLTINRNDLIIKPLENVYFSELKISSLPELKKQSLFMFTKTKSFSIPKKNELIIHPNKLVFPLTVRTKQTGDKFRPYGMKGFKLVSDFLKDEKLSAFEKEKCKLLVNGNGDIIWIAGYRSDDRYKVGKTDSNLLKLTLVD